MLQSSIEVNGLMFQSLTTFLLLISRASIGFVITCKTQPSMPNFVGQPTLAQMKEHKEMKNN